MINPSLKKVLEAEENLDIDSLIKDAISNMYDINIGEEEKDELL